MNTAEYLIKKIEELGITDIFGLPGDYNFNILKAIEKNEGISWIGCTNELNAAYAADGYSRQRGYGAVVTTFGVGELSALNGIAGSFSENVPVIHIVGAPSTSTLMGKKLVHHSLNNNNQFIYKKIFENVVETATFLNRDNAKIEIDRVLKIFVKERKPVYIAIPQDIAELEISTRNVDYTWQSDEVALNAVVRNILEKLEKSINPVILGDVLIKRFDCKNEFNEFVETSGIPTTNFLMGIGIVNNTIPNYVGTYFHSYNNIAAQKILEETDCLISVGVIYSDLNAFGFNLPYKINSQIAIYGTCTYIDEIKYENVKMSEVLSLLSKTIKYKEFKCKKDEYGYKKLEASANILTSEYIYPRIQEFIKENDVFFAETGVVQQGCATIDYPANIDLNLQALWGSIGWATPAAFGAAIANPQKRVILLTGEGAHQLTAIELGNMLRYNVKPVIIVLNNNGYSIERILSDNSLDKFNDIVKMNYSKFARVFEGDVWATKVETEDDFDKALKVSQIMNKLCYIEVIIKELDVPELTRKMISDFKQIEKFERKQENKIITKIKEESEKINKHEKMTFNTKIHESLRKD